MWQQPEQWRLKAEQQDTDRWALDNGYVAITPTQIDVTAYEFLKQKEDWEQ